MQTPSPQAPGHYYSLEDELDHVKLEIVKMMSDKEGKPNESKRLQNYEKKISELETENQKLREKAIFLESNEKTECFNEQKADKNLLIPDILVDRSNLIDLITHTERTSPDGQERDEETQLHHCPCSSIDKGLVIENARKSNSVLDIENTKLLESKR